MTDVSHFAPGPSVLPSASESRQSLQRMIAVIAKTQGYDGIQSSAMAYILNNLEKLLLSLPTHAHELAIMANRRMPSTRDVYLALQHSGPRLRQAELEQYLQASSLDPPKWAVEADIIPDKPAWSDPLEGCLPSESEDNSDAEDQQKEEPGLKATRSKVGNDVPARRRRRRRFRPDVAEVPHHLPSFPPKHTWLSTPSYPAHSMTLQPPLAFLDLKVSSNRLMESSLRGLIRATDAAVLDSQVQRGAFSTDALGQGLETADASMVQSLADESQDISKQSVALATNDSSVDVNEQEANSMRLKKGRTLSLRLRTSSTSQPSGSFFPPLESPASSAQRPSLHRQSMSISGPQSAVVPSFASHFRHNTFSAGPWSANSSQTPLSWNSTIQTGDTTMSPLPTPLTAGAAYHYPPTPSQTYTNDTLSLDRAKQMSDQDTAPVGLPPIVNYKRTWYKKSNNVSTAPKRIKS